MSVGQEEPLKSIRVVDATGISRELVIVNNPSMSVKKGRVTQIKPSLIFHAINFDIHTNFGAK